MLLEDIYHDIKNSYGTVWNFKERGETLEVITPYVTTLNAFVSVFITKRGEEYIVSDGGWMNAGEYETELEFDEHCFGKVFFHYESVFKIQSSMNGDRVVYFKKTNNSSMVPSLVMDLGIFISTIISTSSIAFIDEQEKESRRVFHSKVRAYLTEQFNPQSINFNGGLDGYKSIKFNVIIRDKNKLSLVNYATGFSPNDFNNSIFRSYYNFQFSFQTKYNDQIKNRIALIDNEANGFAPAKVSDHIENLKSIGVTAINWSEKEKIKELV